MSWDEWDEPQRPAPEVTDFDCIGYEAVSRRGFLGGLLAFGSGAAVMGTGLLKSSTLPEAHCCLTNNSRRAPGFTNAGGDLAEPVDGSHNPREENRYGQIVSQRRRSSG